MTFKEKIANYVLGNFKTRDLIGIATEGLSEGIESESMIILAGLNDTDPTYMIEKYFQDAMSELNFHVPNELEAAKIMLNVFLKEIIEDPENAYNIMRKIDNKVYGKYEWLEKFPHLTRNYVGEELGLQHMYTWYRELQDFEDGGMLLYFNELPKEQQKKKFEEMLVTEAKNLVTKLKMELA